MIYQEAKGSRNLFATSAPRIIIISQYSCYEHGHHLGRLSHLSPT